MWSWRRKVGASIGATLLGLWAAGAVAQPAAGSGATGIDLVILIDQSGSMWGHPKWHPEKNDAWGHRIGAAQEVVHRLLEDVWGSSVVHRFSVIDFADRAEVAWSGQVLRYDPKDPEALMRGIGSLLAERVRAKTGEEWINTNTPLALETARQELAKMGAAEPRTGRRKIVLVITDGRAIKPPATPVMMRDRVAFQARELRREGTELWVIGLNDADYYWLDGDGAFWESLAGPGHARLAERAATSLSPVVHAMMEEWLNGGKGGKSGPIPPPSIKDHYECPPYLGRLTFRVGFGTPHAEIRILDPDGVELARTAGGPLSEPGTYAHFTRDDPRPGLYRIDKRTDRSYSVDVEEEAPRIERLTPAGIADLGVTAPLVFQVKALSGKPLQILPKWPIRASVRLTSPTGKVQELHATARPGGRFETLWKPETPGIYQAELRGLVRLADGTERDVFQADPRAYPRRLEVSNRRAFGLRLDTPRPDSGLRVAPWAKMGRIELSLVDGDGKPVEKPRDLVKAPESWLALQAIDPSGAPVAAPVPLAPTGTGSFSALVPLQLSWRSTSGLTRQGRLYLKVLPQPGRLAGDGRLSSIQLPPEIQDRRVGGDPMTVGPIDLLLPRWLIGLGIFFLLLVVAWLAWIVLGRVLPGFLIGRQDVARGRNVHLKIFDLAADPAGLSGLSLPVGGGSRFKLDGKVSFSVGGERVVANRFRVTRLMSSLKSRARLEYRWQGKREVHTTDLTAGSFKTLKDLPAEMGRTVVMLTDTK